MTRLEDMGFSFVRDAELGVSPASTGAIETGTLVWKGFLPFAAIGLGLLGAVVVEKKTAADLKAEAEMVLREKGLRAAYEITDTGRIGLRVGDEIALAEAASVLRSGNRKKAYAIVLDRFGNRFDKLAKKVNEEYGHDALQDVYVKGVLDKFLLNEDPSKLTGGLLMKTVELRVADAARSITKSKQRDLEEPMTDEEVMSELASSYAPVTVLSGTEKVTLTPEFSFPDKDTVLVRYMLDDKEYLSPTTGAPYLRRTRKRPTRNLGRKIEISSMPQTEEGMQLVENVSDKDQREIARLLDNSVELQKILDHLDDREGTVMNILAAETPEERKYEVREGIVRLIAKDPSLSQEQAFEKITAKVQEFKKLSAKLSKERDLSATKGLIDRLKNMHVTTVRLQRQAARARAAGKEALAKEIESKIEMTPIAFLEKQAANARASGNEDLAKEIEGAIERTPFLREASATLGVRGFYKSLLGEDFDRVYDIAKKSLKEDRKIFQIENELAAAEILRKIPRSMRENEELYRKKLAETNAAKERLEQTRAELQRVGEHFRDVSEPVPRWKKVFDKWKGEGIGEPRILSYEEEVLRPKRQELAERILGEELEYERLQGELSAMQNYDAHVQAWHRQRAENIARRTFKGKVPAGHYLFPKPEAYPLYERKLSSLERKRLIEDTRAAIREKVSALDSMISNLQTDGDLWKKYKSDLTSANVALAYVKESSDDWITVGDERISKSDALEKLAGKKSYVEEKLHALYDSVERLHHEIPNLEQKMSQAAARLPEVLPADVYEHLAPERKELEDALQKASFLRAQSS